jgi:hypothetical protein
MRTYTLTEKQGAQSLGLMWETKRISPAMLGPLTPGALPDLLR